MESKLLNKHMLEIEKYLIKNKVAHFTYGAVEQNGTEQIKIGNEGADFSIIYGPFSYGNNKGLLETWDFVNDVIGFRTSDEVIEDIKKLYGSDNVQG